MTESVAKTERTRLNQSLRTAIDQTESRAKLAFATKNTVLFARWMPEHRNSGLKRVDRGTKQRQHEGIAILLGECQLKWAHDTKINWECIISAIRHNMDRGFDSAPKQRLEGKRRARTRFHI